MSGGKHRRPEPAPAQPPEARGLLAPDVPPTGGDERPNDASAVGPGPTVTAVPAMASATARTVVARRSRATERAARRAQQRRRLLAGCVVVLLATLAGAGVWRLGDQAGSGPAAGAGPGPDPQLVTLVQVTGADGTAAASAIVGTTAATGSAVAMLVPSRLQVDVAGSGNLPFGEASTLGDPGAPAAALTDLLGVRVSDSWTLTQPALAALVDAVGGVPAAVDVDVVQTAPNGAQTVVVRAGKQVLKGQAAAAYATYLAAQEPEQARLARFDEVLTALLAKLPPSPSGIAAVLAKAGAGSASSLAPPALAGRLAVLRAAAAGDGLVSDVLPVNSIDTGGSVVSYGLNAGDAAAALRAAFPGALQGDPTGGVVRVLVENGVGTPGLVEAARTKLVDGGFAFKNGGNASSFNTSPSTVQVPDGTAASIGMGRRVATVLGLPSSSVVPSDRGQNVADVIVILGSDFRP